MSNSTRFVKIVSPLAVAIALAACGGDSEFGAGSKTSTDTSGTTDTSSGTDTGTGVADPVVLSLSDMNIGIEDLSAGGSTGITVNLVDQDGDFAKTEETVTFTSACISNGQSEIDSPIVSGKGVFTTTYVAKGCEGEDVITAETGGLSVQGTVDVQPANLGAVEFVSAEPQNILLKGMSAAGQQHTSTVKFQIKNDVGGPIANTDVTFELVTQAAGDGGITLSSTEGKTDNDGFVSTILQAGTVHTSVRVRATVEKNGVTIQSESSDLAVSTGIADQNSLSLSFSVLNPAAWNHDGVEVDVNIIASDRYNTPVPDGTTVAFYTELGSIEPSCTTTQGRCTVKWTSSDPRDLGITDNRYPRDLSNYNSDGISTITAKVIGEESFIDSNANGIFDDGDQFDTNSDRGEAYADYNMGYDTDGDGIKDSSFDDGLDRFILDYNGNGVRDEKDGLYTGLGCNHPTLCAPDNGLKDIFTSGEIVMSEDNQSFRIWRNKDNALVVDTSVGQVYAPLTHGLGYTVEVFGQYNKQVPPIGTSISASSEHADVVVGSAEVVNTNAHGVDLTNPYGPYPMPLYMDVGDSLSGNILLNITTGIDSTTSLPYDGIAPTITLNGSETVIYTSLGAIYNEEGASASDNYGTMNPIVMGGDIIDTSTEGRYEVTYTAEDLAGNVSTEVREIIVDITPPTLALRGFSTVDLTVGSTYTEAGVTVNDNVDIDASSLETFGTVDTSTVGTYTIEYRIQDTAGYWAVPVTRTVNVNP